MQSVWVIDFFAPLKTYPHIIMRDWGKFERYRIYTALLPYKYFATVISTHSMNQC